jgi:UDP-3-O-[3-hydroxymyristoyl] glucosamine N-acyltransferase
MTLHSLQSYFLDDTVIVGNPNVEVRYMRPFHADYTEQGGMTLALEKKISREQMSQSRASVIITDHRIDAPSETTTFLVTRSARLQMAKFTHLFAHPTQTLDTVRHTNPDGSISTVQISPRAYIDSNVYIGNGTSVYANVTLYRGTSIGQNCIIHSNTTIGADGFGYEKDEHGNWFKMAHLGGVAIGNDVEIGANTSIDRGTLGDTIIEDNVKIDNLVHIAHNAHIKRNALIIAHAMIAGSCIIGENSWIAPGTMVRDGIEIGANAFVGLGSVVVKNVEAESLVYGVPARKVQR